MTTATKTFAKKGVYHSELVRETDPSGLKIVLKSKPRDSKYKDKPPYIYFGVVGEDSEHVYNIENDEIRAYLEQCPTAEPVTIHAFGTRESATVQVDTEDGAAVLNGEPIGKHPQNGPPPLYPEDEDEYEPPESATGSAQGDLYLQCLLSARSAHSAFSKTTGTPVSDDDIRIATTMFINASK